jgi:hypothetical protein
MHLNHTLLSTVRNWETPDTRWLSNFLRKKKENIKQVGSDSFVAQALFRNAG